MTRATPILAALTLALVLTACSKGGKPDEAKAAAKPAAPLLLAPEDLREVGQSGLIGAPVISGAIQPARRADLRAEVAAVVLQVAKDNGERVRAGDLIIRLDPTAIRDSLTSAEEAVRAAQQSFEQAERVLAPGAALIKQDDPVVARIEKPSLVGFGAAAWSAVDKQHRLALRIAALLEIQLVKGRHAQEACAVRLVQREEGQEGAGSRRSWQRAGCH